MSELSELYQQVILDHNKKPRNFRKLETANRMADGHNPLCGDQLTVYLKYDEGIVQEITFEGQGCAISKAAASMMTQSVKGMSKEEAESLFLEFHQMVTGALDEENTPNNLGRLKIFSEYAITPPALSARASWHTMRAALEGQPVISTEGAEAAG
ncbi:MAG: Fe-S cluster assembly sulfur transfer protein SufU [Pyrinomonadaceae bacterium]